MSLPSRELPDHALDALAARERTRIVAPLTEWRTLAAQLHQEGLLRAPDALPFDHAVVEPSRGRGWVRGTARWTVRLAAAALLLGVGIVTGRGMTFGHELLTSFSTAIADSTDASTTHVRVSGTPFGSAAAARAALVRSEAEYQRASAFLAATDTAAHTSASPEVYEDRLAALDQMAAAAKRALKDAPDDPLLNQYYLSTVEAREATIQQLARSLPADSKVVRF